MADTLLAIIFIIIFNQHEHMNPVYRFVLYSPKQGKLVNPLYDQSLSKNYSRESGQMFFRAKLEGKLKFVKDDYDFIMATAFDDIMHIDVQISYDAGTTWERYFYGKFTRTDCTINPDECWLETALEPADSCESVLSGLDREFNLIELAPEIKAVRAVKRPAIQIYAAGDSVVTSFVGNMCFEQSSSVVDDEDSLIDTYKFANCGYVREFLISNDGPTVSADEEILGTYIGFQKDRAIIWSVGLTQIYTKFNNNDIQLEVTSGGTDVSPLLYFRVRKISTNTVIAFVIMPLVGEVNPSYDGSNFLIDSSNTENSYTMSFVQTPLFTRVLTNVDSLDGTTLYELPVDDILGNNMNYAKVYPLDTSAFVVSTQYSTVPTEYGLIKPGQYFTKPEAFSGETLSPVSRSQWINASIWFNTSIYNPIDAANRDEYEMKHAYVLWSCINVLLKQIAPELKFNKSSSEFIGQLNYGVNPVSSIPFEILITQKTNVLKGEYDMPAQKAMITLKQMFDMLKNCFQCYWYIDGDELKIEHISYFQNGLTYANAAKVGIDLTKLFHSRSLKPWSFGTSNYTFEKENMPAWYQFEWADDVTFPFKGHEIEVVSNYVKKDNTETISVNRFVSDIDLMLLNPTAFSEDGMVLLIAQRKNIMPSTFTFSTTPAGLTQDIALSETVEVDSQCKISGISKISEVKYKAIFVGANGTSLGETEYSRILLLANNKFTITGTAPAGTSRIRLQSVNSAGAARPSAGNVSLFECDSIVSLPVITKTIDTKTYTMQNGYAAFCDLQEKYYTRSFPASKVIINKTQITVKPTRGKKQEVEFPAEHTDPDMYALVHTSLGDGQIEDIKINLSSRLAKATLKHDTEK